MMVMMVNDDDDGEDGKYDDGDGDGGEYDGDDGKYNDDDDDNLCELLLWVGIAGRLRPVGGEEPRTGWI